MSVSYFMACDGCKEAVAFCEWKSTGFHLWGDLETREALQAFLAKHTLCGSATKPRLLDEGTVEIEGFEKRLNAYE